MAIEVGGTCSKHGENNKNHTTLWFESLMDRLLGRPWHRQIILKTELREIGCAGANRIELDQDRTQWWVGFGNDGSELSYSVTGNLLTR
jgi:hypothetical protein